MCVPGAPVFTVGVNGGGGPMRILGALVDGKDGGIRGGQGRMFLRFVIPIARVFSLAKLKVDLSSSRANAPDPEMDIKSHVPEDYLRATREVHHVGHIGGQPAVLSANLKRAWWPRYGGGGQGLSNSNSACHSGRALVRFMATRCPPLSLCFWIHGFPYCFFLPDVLNDRCGVAGPRHQGFENRTPIRFTGPKVTAQNNLTETDTGYPEINACTQSLQR